MNKVGNVKKKKEFMHSYVIIVIFVLIAVAMTYLIPAGNYEFVKDEATGRNVIDPDSFTTVANTPVSIIDLFLLIPKAFADSQSIIFLMFLTGGLFQIVNDTGAIDMTIDKMIKKLSGRELIIIPVIIVLISILGALNIIVNAVVAFIPLGIVVARKLKTDGIVALGLTYLAVYAGFGSTPMGPLTTIIAQEIAGLPAMSGFGLRAVVWVIITGVSIVYVMRYAKKVRDDNGKTILDSIEWGDDIKDLSSQEYKPKHAIIMLIMFAGFILFGYGAFKYKWSTDYLIAIMAAVAIFSGIIARMSANDMCKSFISGCNIMVVGCMGVGLCKLIILILTDGNIIHSLIFYACIPLSQVPNVISAIGMFLVNLGFNFAVPSGSGQAVIVMPIMTPLSDIIGVSRQVAVSAFQYGDGFSNVVLPTSGTLLACIGIAKVPFNKWIKFILPLFLIWVAIGMVVLTFATLTGWA